MSEYIIVQRFEEDMELLINRVNQLLAEGYVPVGGIAVRTGAAKGAYLLQAMIKEEATLQELANRARQAEQDYNNALLKSEMEKEKVDE